METRKNRSSLFGPILLIGLGILLLLSNLGVLTVNVWQMLFRFWPVILIAVGLDILFGRRSGIGAIIA
ncbi:MAG: cell wall-active antibiotics response protein, partial [Chloroflexi bacterium]